MLIALLLSLAAAPSTEGANRVLVLDFTANGVEESVARTVTTMVAHALQKRDGIDVTTSADVKRLADVEAARQSSGCDDASCLSEIADALGAQRIVFGEVGKVQGILIVAMNVFDAGEARFVGREVYEVENIKDLEDETTLAVSLLTERKLWEKPLFWTGTATGAVGAVLALGGGVVAFAASDTLADADSLGDQKAAARNTLPIAFVAAGVGLVATLGGAVLAVIGAASE